MMLLGICVALIGQVSGLEVREITATKGHPSSPFGTIGSMVQGAPGEVIISDDVQPALHLWKIGTGDSVKVLAREGRGPGEVRTPTALARRPSGGFALYDIGNGGVLLYDAAMRFERRVVLQGGFVSNPKSLAVLHDESFVLAGGRIRDPRHLHRYSAGGEWLESFGAPPEGLESPTARIQSAGGALRTTPGGFLFSVGTPLRILCFPTPGLNSPELFVEDLALLPELNESTAHGPADPRFGGQRPYLWFHDRSTGVFQLADGRVLNVVTRYYQGDSVWDVYTAEGQRVARQIVPRAYHAWDLTHDGHVLVSYRDPDTDESVAAVVQVTIE